MYFFIKNDMDNRYVLVFCNFVYMYGVYLYFCIKLILEC